jgi:hypothetical protein
MSDTPPPSQDSISEEFRRLGENLIDTLRAAWDSPERKRLHQEVSEGLDELAKTIRMEIETFEESPTGQRLRSDVEDLRQRIRTGEMESKLRTEMLNALRLVNEELHKVSEHWKGSSAGTPETDQAPQPEQPATPPSDPA